MSTANGGNLKISVHRRKNTSKSINNRKQLKTRIVSKSRVLFLKYGSTKSELRKNTAFGIVFLVSLLSSEAFRLSQ